MKLLNAINFPSDLKKIPEESLACLASEIREALIKKASEFGGHLASNLGVVELTIALHYVFDCPFDKLIFDVSHQSYVHKMLTGRKDAFLKKEKYAAVTGYTNPLESEYDCFNIGHTSTSISLASGLAKYRDLKGSNENIVAIIGDSSLDGGEAFEALNIIGEMNTGIVIVVNDNNMSIPENHGALNNHLAELRKTNGKSNNNFFKSLGFDYKFVENGHNISLLIKEFRSCKDTKKPIVVHCVTKKGKGYTFAEENPEKWHWAHPFSIETGEFLKKSSVPSENYGSIAGNYLMEKINDDSNVVAMTASVPAYFGFNKCRREKAGKQFVDVGISEQNGVTMAAAIAKSGGKPVFITGSSFYQRAYDQIQQELCINKCPATLLVAFSGIFGHNSNAHAGLYDISLMGNIPGLTYLAPTNKQEYLAMLDWSIDQNDGPVAIRIPWNGVHYAKNEVHKNYSDVRYQINKNGSEIAIIGLGSFYQLAEEVAKLIEEKKHIHPTLINPLFINKIDEETLNVLKKQHRIVITLEDGIVSGGFGSRISQFYGDSCVKVLNFGFSMNLPTVFDPNEVMIKNGLTPELIVKRIFDVI